ncbi:BatD family protein [Alistipes sp.]|uniref:BatD family protein n=5 Tax=Alistipes TaxID=239759 RepID=UPI0011DC738F|nr:BatD family protein [Alistipes sp.]
MRNLFAKITVCLLLCAAGSFSALGAEKVIFEASSPLVVAVGELFRVEFSLNTRPDEQSFRAPSFEGFEVLAGPSLSEGTSMSSVNGGPMTRQYQMTLTYVVRVAQAGNVTLGPAEIAAGGETYRTAPLTIEAVAEPAEAGGGSAQGGAGQGQGGGDASQEAGARRQVAADDVVLRAVVSRTSVFKGEPLRVTFKLYERVPVAGYNDVKFPSFNGFWAQELDHATPRRQRETLNGKVYESFVAREFLLYPQQAGKLAIDPAELTAVAQVVVQSRNFDPFFGPSHEVYNVPCKVQSQRLTVEVKPLPEGAPASFSGAVGQFALEAVLPPERLAANSAATYTVKISGTGNLTFVQAPRLALPGSFEQYNVKTIESINPTASGITGYRQFEYPFIARAEGDYDLEPVEFSYFDPARMRYETLRSKPLAVQITPDGSGGGEAVMMQGRGMSKEEVRLLGQDIRFIRLGAPHLGPERRPFLFGGVYWALLAAIVALSGAAYALLRKRIRESHNLALVRGRRANKVAVQRFRAARKYMEEQNRHAFYEEMLRALWGYMGDRFNIPVANLTKENVREELHKRGAESELQQRFTAIITRCDEAQYSPVATAQMSEVYTEGVDLVSRIEGAIKR